MDIQSFSDALVWMCNQPEKRYKMGIAARKRVAKYFLHEDMIKKYLEVYDEVFRRWQG